MKTVTQRLIRYHKFEVVVLGVVLVALAYEVSVAAYDLAIILGGIAIALFATLGMSYASRRNLDAAQTQLARARAYRETVERSYLNPDDRRDR